MFRKVQSKKELFTASAIFTSLFYLLANSYRFFSPLLSGDSLLMIHQNDSAWEISLGRFVQPFLVFLRGGIITPFLISVLAILWILLSVYFLVDFLKIERVLSVAFVAAVMTCNSTILGINTAFVHFIDFYTLALFLAVFGTWLVGKAKPGTIILGIACLSISMGIYQSYVCVGLGMVILYYLFHMTEKPGFKKVFPEFWRYVLSFAAAAALYLILWKLMQWAFHVWTADTYNGMAGLGDYSESSLWEVLQATYSNVFMFFWYPKVFTTIPFRGLSLSVVWIWLVRLANASTVLALVFVQVRKNVRYKTLWWHRLAQVLLLGVLPLGINFVCILSKGMEHDLMTYAFCLVYIAAIKAVERELPEDWESFGRGWKRQLPGVILTAALAVVAWTNLVYFNQVYVKKDLEEQATQSLMSRIVHDVESMEGYVAGETPVAFWGSFERTDYTLSPANFEELNPYGVGKTPLIYEGTEYAYLKYMINVKMNLTRIPGDNEKAIKMPTYPAEGSVAYVDNVIVVKISE